MEKKKIIYLLLFINCSSFFFGFFFLEEHGASILDATEHTYPAINALKINFLENIINYGKFGENSYPLHHIIFAFLNPFEPGSFFFKLISIFWSFASIYLLFLVIKKRLKFSNLESIFLSSILLLSPYFRSSGYWGMTENTGILFLILSIFFYLELRKNMSYLNIFFVCLFSSLALYSRIQYVFICLFYFIDLFFTLTNVKRKFLILCYSILSIPALYLIYIWGGIIDEQTTGEFNSLINFDTIPRTFFAILSLVGFYSLPFLICLNKDYINLLKKYFIKYFISLFFLISMFYFSEIDILSLNEKRDYVYGQGFIANITYKITKIQISYLLFSAIGLNIILSLFQYSIKNKILIVAFFTFFSLRVHFFTEYLDPLLFILALGCLTIKNISELKKLRNLLIFEIFFILTLIGAILI